MFYGPYTLLRLTDSISQSSSDIPLLVSLRTLAQRLLSNYITPIPPLSAGLIPPSTATPSSTPGQNTPFPLASPIRSSSPLPSTSLNDPLVDSTFHIGFITPPWKDNKIPVKDHLHVHAYVEPLDLAGWWRGVSYGPLAWYAIDDLIAEIRYVLQLVRSTDGPFFKKKAAHMAFVFLFVLITTQ